MALMEFLLLHCRSDLLLLSSYERGNEELVDSLILLPEVVFICVTMMVFKCGILSQVFTVWSRLSSIIAVYC